MAETAAPTPARDRLHAGLGLWAGGVALAFVAQSVILESPARGYALFTGAAAACAAGMLAIDAALPDQRRSRRQVTAELPVRTRRAAISFGLVAMGLLASAGVFRLVPSAGASAVTMSLWISSLALVGFAAVCRQRGALRLRRPRMTRKTAIRLSPLVAVLVLALLLRLPELEDLPPDVHGDEASIGIEARFLLDGRWGELFGVGWAGLPRLGYAFAAIPLRIFGNDLYGLRMASLIEGLLSVVLLYLVVRRLFGPRPALLAAFVLAVEQWHIHFSRTGFHYMQALPAALLVVLFALRALDEKRALDFLLLGVALALCVTVYYAAREIALIVGPYVLYRIAREHVFIRRNLIGLAWVLVGFWVFLAPVLATLSHESQSLVGTRAGEDWLFSARNLAHERVDYGTSSTLDIVGIQVRRTLEAVNRTGETSVQWGRVGKPLFDPWTAALVVPGVAYALLRIRSARYLLPVAWLAVPLLVSIFTVDAPVSMRMITALPVLAVFPALVVAAGWRAVGHVAGRTGQLAFVPLAALLGALALVANYQDYFQEHVKSVRVAGFPTLVSRYAGMLDEGYRVYLVSHRLSLGYETVRFLVPNLDGEDLGGDPRLPPLGHPPAKAAAFVVDVAEGRGQEPLAALERLYPRAHRALHRDAKGDAVFVSYEVAAADVVRPLRRQAFTSKTTVRPERNTGVPSRANFASASAG